MNTELLTNTNEMCMTFENDMRIILEYLFKFSFQYFFYKKLSMLILK